MSVKVTSALVGSWKRKLRVWFSSNEMRMYGRRFSPRILDPHVPIELDDGRLDAGQLGDGHPEQRVGAVPQRNQAEQDDADREVQQVEATEYSTVIVHYRHGRPPLESGG